MSNRIYWFSGTGNSLYVAKRAAQSIDAELHEISDFVENPMKSSEKVGIVCPVYAFGVPRAVQKALKKVEGKLGDYVFTILTYAQIAGGASDLVSRTLKKTGNSLDASYGVLMPTNYPPFGGSPTEDLQKAINKKAEEQIDEIIAAIKEERKGRFEHTSTFYRMIARPFFPLFMMGLKSADKKFYADERCTSCGVCESVCPVNNIQVNDKPVWLGHCEQCFACFHFCPEKAIQQSEKTIEQVRYHHPGITLKEIRKCRERESNPHTPKGEGF